DDCDAEFFGLRRVEKHALHSGSFSRANPHGQVRPARAIALVRGSGAVVSGCFHPVELIL
ncbi:MAG: hypothetical protein LBV29_04635, partial [Azoarcus sp.]|nr:hypothetical protein [Azoarcus sp.]